MSTPLTGPGIDRSPPKAHRDTDEALLGGVAAGLGPAGCRGGRGSGDAGGPAVDDDGPAWVDRVEEQAGPATQRGVEDVVHRDEAADEPEGGAGRDPAEDDDEREAGSGRESVRPGIERGAQALGRLQGQAERRGGETGEEADQADQADDADGAETDDQEDTERANADEQ